MCTSSLGGPDPNCPHCKGNIRVPKSTVNTTPEFDEVNSNRWQLDNANSQVAWDNDDQSVMSLDSQFSFGSQPAELSPRKKKTKKNEKSKVFQKFKELSKLKKEGPAGSLSKTRNLQIERSEEIDFS